MTIKLVPAVAAMVLGAVAVVPPAGAQVPPGEEFAVNTYTTGTQRGATLAADAAGNFVAVWTSYRQDGDRNGVFARRFDRLGAPRGPEFRVNVATTGNQFEADVASDAAGNFMVVWRTELGGGGQQLVGRRYDAAGAPRSGEMPLIPPTLGLPYGTLAMHPPGDALFVWSGLTGLQGRRYDPTGAPVGADFTISTAGGPKSPDAAAAPDGGYLVVWQAAIFGDIFARRFDAAGSPIGDEFRVNTYTTADQETPEATFDGDGGFMVAWDHDPFGAADVRARRFAASGQPLGADFLLSENGADHQCCPLPAADRDGNYTVLWTGWENEFDVFARRFDAAGVPLGGQFKVPAGDTFFQVGGGLLVGPGGHATASYDSDLADGSFSGVLGRLMGSVAMALALALDGNGVLEAGETVALAPSWANAERAASVLAGTLSEIAGPGPSSYAIVDGAANYGTVAPAQTASCTAMGDCYSVSVSLPAVRPATHWDASARERVTGLGDMTWKLHVGGSFTDVPASSPYYRFVETLLHRGVSGGCTAETYCPSASTTREQMAVFVLAAREGSQYRPVACGTPLFADVPAGSPFCPFVEELARRGVVSGCGGGNYCPTAAVTREEMAVLVLRTLDPALDPPACGTPLFGDVPASSPFCRWIEELARRGVVSGCGGGNYCPGQAVSREQMAVFVSVTFGLTLYGP